MISRLYLTAASYAAVAAAGWLVNSWYTDSINLAEKRAADKAIAAFEVKESAVAASVEAKLAELRANERTRTIRVPEIIKQPEFINVCISKDGVASINAAVRSLYGTDDKKRD